MRRASGLLSCCSVERGPDQHRCDSAEIYGAAAGVYRSIDLPATDLPEPITPLKRERLLAMGEAAAQSLLTQIEQKSGYLTRVSLAPEPTVGLVPAGVEIAVERVQAAERFVD